MLNPADIIRGANAFWPMPYNPYISTNTYIGTDAQDLKMLQSIPDLSYFFQELGGWCFNAVHNFITAGKQMGQKAHSCSNIRN